jgi:hypothetical protein
MVNTRYDKILTEYHRIDLKKSKKNYYDYYKTALWAIKYKRNIEVPELYFKRQRIPLWLRILLYIAVHYLNIVILCIEY